MTEPHYLRALPWTSDYGRKLHIEPGMGRFTAQSVGNTAHTTGLDFSVHLDGAAEATWGVLRFRCAITREGTVEWRMDDPARFTAKDGTLARADVQAVARRLAESHYERSQASYCFHVMSAAEMELARHDYRIGQMERTIDLTTGWLADPTEPRSTEKLPLTEDERSERRAYWARSLERTRPELAAYHAENGEHIMRLRGLVSALRDWCHHRAPMWGRPIQNVIAATLKFDIQVQAA